MKVKVITKDQTSVFIELLLKIYIKKNGTIIELLNFCAQIFYQLTFQLIPTLDLKIL